MLDIILVYSLIPIFFIAMIFFSIRLFAKETPTRLKPIHEYKSNKRKR